MRRSTEDKVYYYHTKFIRASTIQRSEDCVLRQKHWIRLVKDNLEKKEKNVSITFKYIIFQLYLAITVNTMKYDFEQLSSHGNVHSVHSSIK